jgi:hypothetical protein
VVGREHDQGMVPGAAGIVDALAATGPEGPQCVGPARVRPGGDDDDPGMVLQRNERLGTERMAFHERETQGGGARLAAEDADEGASAPCGNIDAGEIVEALGKSGIDGEMRSTLGLDDIAEGGEGFARQGLDVEGGYDSSFPSRCKVATMALAASSGEVCEVSSTISACSGRS